MYYVSPGDEVRVLVVWHTHAAWCLPVPFQLWFPSGARIHSVLLYSEDIHGGKQGNDAAAGAGGAETP